MLPFLDLRLSTRELRPEIDRAVARVLDSGSYIGGAETSAFESSFADSCGALYAVGTGNGLDALILMLRAYGISLGDEVIVPSNTYIATWLAVSAVSAQVVPVEPARGTYNLDPNLVEAAITKRTRAILAVHLFGRRADIESLGEIAVRRGLPLLVDSAQAHGIMHAGDACAFSFYPSKNLGALGDAGAVTTNDPKIAERIRVLGNYGSREKYCNEIRGVNSRLDPLQAAVLRVKLAFLPDWNRRRQEIARRYQDALRELPGLGLPERVIDIRENVWHVFAVRSGARDLLARQLAELGIGTLIHYPQPPHLSRAYADAGFNRGDFPIAEELADQELSLPLHPHLTTFDVDRVITEVREAASRVERGEACHSRV